MRHLIVAALLLVAAPLFAVEPFHIQDNSFLIEEAYNQEPGVVQGIFTLMAHGGESVMTFTNEMPVRGQKHQFSYTLSGLRFDGRSGIGDSALNYRYQLVGDGSTRLAISPRVSVLVPTGDEDREMGSGQWGYELNVPLSYAISDKLVTHWNAGLTHAGDSTPFVGGSVIAAVREKFNVMLEARLAGDGEGAVVSPGMRWAVDLKSGLQIVPGIAVPITNDTTSVFFYLSLEK